MDRGLLEAMQRRATATAGEFVPQGVANVLWALASTGERADRGLLKAMHRRAMATAGEFYPQAVANMLWALAVMGVGGSDESLDGLISRLAARILEVREQLTHEAKCQLHQWLLSCELGLLSGASLSTAVARVKEEIGQQCLQAFSAKVTHGSRLQREVATALRKTVPEMEIEEEYRDARSGYSIDVLLRRRSAVSITGGAKSPEERAGGWAVEVDGPTHFLQAGRMPSGNTLLKRKQLGQLGYTVVPVTFWEWDALRGEEAKRRHVEDKLRGG